VAVAALFVLFAGCGRNPQAPAGMTLVPGGEFNMGSEANFAFPNEKPVHRIQVAPFFLDVHPVTNAKFAKFVEATGYKTVAERAVEWEEMKKQLPPGTPKPPEEVLQPGSLVFRPTSGPVNLRDMSQWWVWEIGASWKHPEGEGSSIQGRENHPVVQPPFPRPPVRPNGCFRRLPPKANS
jgi:formylglycine-generating enzyme required for sulfatase activity